MASPHLRVPTTQIDESPNPLNDERGSQPNTWRPNFKSDVQEDDELWNKYLKICDPLDTRIIDEWIKIIDVILVYVALFSGVLTAFIIDTSKQFSPDPTEVASKILAAMYIHQFNSSSPFVDPDTFLILDPVKRSNAVYRNTLLYASLAFSVVVAALATAAKLWVIRYARKVNAPGPPQSRAISRQETYDGAKAWKLEAVIESLPVLALIAVILFVLFIYSSVTEDQVNLGIGVSIIMIAGIAFLFVASFSAAFISTSPFQSAFSDFIHLLFRLFPDFTLLGVDPETRGRLGGTRFWGIITASIGSLVAIPFLVITYSPVFEPLALFPIAGVFALMKKRPSAEDIRPRIYGLPEWVSVSTIIIFSAYSIAGSFSSHPVIYLPIFCLASVILALMGYHGIRMSEIVPDTTKANAIGWMIKFSSSQHPAWFIRACETAGRSQNVKALLLKDLTPLLSPLITSIDCENVTPQQASYVACLAELMHFTPAARSLLRNEAPLRYPDFSDKLTEKLRELEKVQCRQKQQGSSHCAHDGDGSCPYDWVQDAAQDALKYLDLHSKRKRPFSMRHDGVGQV